MNNARGDNKPGREQGAPPPAEEAAPAAAAPGQGGKSAAAVELGRRGGQKGGPARARKLTAEQRAAIARKAAQARWAQRRQG